MSQYSSLRSLASAYQPTIIIATSDYLINRTGVEFTTREGCAGGECGQENVWIIVPVTVDV